MTNKPLNLIVAATAENGIGINGSLPWRLRKDMDFFKEMTIHGPDSTTEQGTKKNIVVMGRKTFESIPLKFRPLKDRINCILSRDIDFLNELQRTSKDCRGFSSFAEAVDFTNSWTQGDVWIIGGSSVYEEALKSDQCDRIFLTRVSRIDGAPIPCDTFLPLLNLDAFDEHLLKSETEGEYHMDFYLYKRK